MRAALLRHVLVGAVLGVLVLHPVNEVIYWFESHPNVPAETGTLWHSLGRRFLLVFTPRMLPMTGLFGLVGAALGLGFGWYYRMLVRRRSAAAQIQEEFERDLASAIAAREGERLEFKASARWDAQFSKTNKVLEEAMVRTIAGFLNHEGGSLLVGVADSGEIVGMDRDYRTLKRPDRDGFELFVMGLVKHALGGDVCAHVHVRFRSTDGKDVCQIAVEPSERPVYCQDGAVARYLLRMGNSTRELDVREAMQHIAQRWPGPRRRGRAVAAEPL
jgi:hypothetical protein